MRREGGRREEKSLDNLLSMSQSVVLVASFVFKYWVLGVANYARFGTDCESFLGVYDL